MYQHFFKRIIDFTLSLLGLLVLSPVFLLLWVLIAVSNKGAGAFFTQDRPGKDAKIFKVIKFKTMTDERDSGGALLPDAQRLTKTGKFVRSTSLDEIPQLINVLKGDMSLIGPRPLLVKYLPYYTIQEKLRHSIKPGITGWAQVNGRNTLDWDSRLSLDVYYVENISFNFDLRIIIKTINIVINRENVVIDPTSILKDLDDERKDTN